MEPIAEVSIIDNIMFTTEDIRALKEWLKLEDIYKSCDCPFRRCNGNRGYYCINVCGQIYELDCKDQCPCRKYSLEEVIKNTQYVVDSNPTLGDKLKRWLNGISL